MKPLGRKRASPYMEPEGHTTQESNATDTTVKYQRVQTEEPSVGHPEKTHEGGQLIHIPDT